MSCIIPNNILDINFIQMFNPYIKLSNKKLLSLLIFWILTLFRFFYPCIKSVTFLYFLNIGQNPLKFYKHVIKYMRYIF